MAVFPTVPEKITVHLGAPASDAENVTVNFPYYIKNVASSEIYPTWPESAIRANVLAQISFALNRIDTEYYPSRGYNFDITNDTTVDQAFIPERDIYENISQIVDEIFNTYIVREGAIEPLFALYCDGVNTTCDGLSQWGSVALADQGNGAFDILQAYYGDNISLVVNAPVEEARPSTPTVPLRLGITSNDVRFIQIRLNRISSNYPSIPKIANVNGVFGVDTENAVKAFQRIFSLPENGVVDSATWYKIQRIYSAVKRLNEIVSEGLTFDEVAQQYNGNISMGDEGIEVSVVQYYLNVLSTFDPRMPPVEVSGVFGEETRDAVFTFQNIYGLPITGVVDVATWEKLFDVYYGYVQSIDISDLGTSPLPFPGSFLSLGYEGEDVTVLQQYINGVSVAFDTIPEIPVTGAFDVNTRDAVFAAQSTLGLPINGFVGPILWDRLANLYSDIQSGEYRNQYQFGGENGTVE